MDFGRTGAIPERPLMGREQQLLREEHSVSMAASGWSVWNACSDAGRRARAFQAIAACRGDLSAFIRIHVRKKTA
jgi:hypothetical protein